MTSTKTDITGLVIKDIRVVERLDDHGLDCGYCSDEDAKVEVQIYYTIEEPHEDVFETGCARCMVARALEAQTLGAYDLVMETEAP